MVLLAWPALGGEIRDGSEYAVTLPAEADPCIVFPKSMFDPATCAPGVKPLEQDPSKAPSRVLAVGNIRVDDHTEASLGAWRVDGEDTWRPADLDAFAGGMAEKMVEGRPGSRLRGKPAARFEKIAGQWIGRVSFDLDGFLEGGTTHEIAYTAWSEAGTYVLSLTGPAAGAPDIDATALLIARTIRIARPAQSAPSREYLIGRAIGSIVGVMFLPATAVVIGLIVWRMTRRRSPPGT
jgi:hypothetical protein